MTVHETRREVGGLGKEVWVRRSGEEEQEEEEEEEEEEEDQGTLKGTKQRKPKTQIFAETRRFSQICPFPETSSIWRAQKTTENRRYSQKTEDFRRKPQETADWGPSPWVLHL